MKRNNLLLAISVLLSVAAFPSCTDLMENTYTFIDPYSYYQTEDQMETVMNAVYADFENLFGAWNPLYAMELVTSHAMPAHSSKNNVRGFNCWQGVNQATTYNIDIWDKGYELINRCNVVLGRAGDVDMPQESKERYFGQARFVRAYTMFALLRLYGGLAIPDGYTAGLEGLEIPRKTASETYDYIIEDLTQAISLLPTRSGWGAGNVYKASKGAAQALLGDVWLTRACMNEYNTSYLQNAKTALEEVINSHEYELLPDYKSLWYSFVEEAAKNTKESLFEFQFGSTSNNIYNSLHCYFGINATDASLGANMFARAGVSHRDYLSYSDDDVRKQCFLTEYTITGSGVKRWWEPENLGFSGKGEGKWPTTSPGNMKFYDLTQSSFDTGTAKNNFILIRYSDVLLNYAETENLLNGPTADAYEKLNAVHTRSLPTPVAAGLNQAEFDDALFQERVWEEIGEGLLYYDELRTDRLGKNVWEYKTYMYENGYYNCQKLQFVPQRNFLWKINQKSLDSNPALEQNPDNVSDPRYPVS